MRALDDIAEEAAKQYWETGSLLTSKEIIRAAIDKALEVVLRKEPINGILDAMQALDLEGQDDPYECWRQLYRAMTAALLEELKGNSSVARSGNSPSATGEELFD